MTDKEAIEEALDLAMSCGNVDGDHHKMWVIDQMVRILTKCPHEMQTFKDYKGRPYKADVMVEGNEYKELLAKWADGEDGPDTYGWDEGIAP